MSGKENPQQVGVSDNSRIKCNLYRLGVARLASADILVAGIRNIPARVAGFDLHHTFQLVEHRLGTPETASRKGGYFQRL